ncbi:GTP-binding protein [Limimonas halophila]|uniref:GTPase Der n=1 Tax=Limimonas halophila TaxID=1082479 RepID=A0A1G7MCV9_9PROT|nr:ribosome biogenesis GTPase Der [Limimonas halophila]SDF59648.1 GTP-binding protein [Limimonas halophila]
MTFTVAVVGRPNVGKSTLFNRLAGKRLALVDDTPGVTRDRREADGKLFDLTFRLVDTAGLEEADHASLASRMREQSQRAVEEADVVLFMLDARAGITPSDELFADELRKSDRPVIVLTNKCEGSAGEAGFYEAYELGLGEPVAFSGEHGHGIDELYDRLHAIHEAWREAHDAEDVEADSEEAGQDVVQLAVVGRPNVGKSTLINRLLGEDRLLTGPEAGLTRDAIRVDWHHKGQPMRLVDTAGQRRRARVQDKLEQLAVQDALHAINFAHVVALVADATEGLDRQDLHIAQSVIEEGRALVVVVNKIDAVADADAALRAVRDRLKTSLPQVRGVPVVSLSGLTGRNVETLLDAVLRAYKIWTTKVATPDLNQWLSEVTASHPPPRGRYGKRIRFKYITQPKARPPTFTLFCSQPTEVPGSYTRYLENELRHDFDLPGTPIRFIYKRPKNPYA